MGSLNKDVMSPMDLNRSAKTPLATNNNIIATFNNRRMSAADIAQIALLNRSRKAVSENS